MINAAMQANIGTYNGNIVGQVGGDLILLTSDDNETGSIIQSALGDITISVGGDLYMEINEYGGSAIRTTGTCYYECWRYRAGLELWLHSQRR